MTTGDDELHTDDGVSTQPLGASHAEPLELGLELADRYVTTRVLERGGMSVVYEALDRRSGRAVALKVVPRSRLSRGGVARFANEVRVAAMVRHPALVHLLDSGVLPTGEPFMVMELIAGLPLRERLRAEGPLGPRAVARVLMPVADALDTLHAADVLHRDVKPDNIVLVDERGGDARLVDLGIALVRGKDRITAEDECVGSPRYMAPELVRGEREPTSAVDVYSLAVTAFELVVGRPPFDGSPLDVCRAKVSRPAPLMSDVAGALFSVELELAIAAGLSLDPAKRPLGARALLESIARAVEPR